MADARVAAGVTSLTGQERTKQRSRKLGDPVPMQPLVRTDEVIE
jgi:hypothetical protein